MTTFLLIRHAAHDLLGKTLAGRCPDVHLSARGKMEAERLAKRLGRLPIRAIYTGPLERAQETAWPLVTHLELEPKISAAFDEIDFGEWTGLSFAELDRRPDWHAWNNTREQAQAPGGESMQAVQERVAAELGRLAPAHPDETVAVVTHGDVIRGTLMYYLEIPLRNIHRLEISPSSVSTLSLSNNEPFVTRINDTGIA